MKKLLKIALGLIAAILVASNTPNVNAQSGSYSHWTDDDWHYLKAKNIDMKKTYYFELDDSTVTSSKSSNPKIIKASGKRIKTLKTGNATITVKYKITNYKYYDYNFDYLMDHEYSGEYDSWMKKNHPNVLEYYPYERTYSFKVHNYKLEKLEKAYKKAKHKKKSGKYRNVMLKVGKDIKPGKYTINSKKYKTTVSKWHKPGKYHLKKGIKIDLYADGTKPLYPSYEINKYKNFRSSGYLDSEYFDGHLGGHTHVTAWYKFEDCGFYTYKKNVTKYKGSAIQYKADGTKKTKKIKKAKIKVTLKKGQYIKLDKNTWMKAK